MILVVDLLCNLFGWIAFCVLFVASLRCVSVCGVCRLCLLFCCLWVFWGGFVIRLFGFVLGVKCAL